MASKLSWLSMLQPEGVDMWIGSLE